MRNHLHPQSLARKNGGIAWSKKGGERNGTRFYLFDLLHDILFFGLLRFDFLLRLQLRLQVAYGLLRELLLLDQLVDPVLVRVQLPQELKVFVVALVVFGECLRIFFGVKLG